MNSPAIEKLVTNKILFGDLIELARTAPEGRKELMLRMLVVSLAAFWEAFHEDLWREVVARMANPPSEAAHWIDNFNTPSSTKLQRLYELILGIPDITEEAWWGNLTAKSGQTPVEFRKLIDDMMDLRHDTAHGVWKLGIDPDDCQNYLGAVAHLAIQTDEYVATLFPKP